MVDTVYHPEDNTITISIGDVEERVDLKDFLNGIATEEARIKHLLAQIYEKRAERLIEMSSFIDFIKELVMKEKKIFDRMDEAVEDGDQTKVKMLKDLNKILLDTKNTGRELRFAAKQLEIEEGRLKSQLLELQTGG